MWNRRKRVTGRGDAFKSTINEAKQKEQEKLEIKDFKEAEDNESKEKEVILTPISDEETGKEKEPQKEEQIKV